MPWARQCQPGHLQKPRALVQGSFGGKSGQLECLMLKNWEKQVRTDYGQCSPSSPLSLQSHQVGNDPLERVPGTNYWQWLECVGLVRVKKLSWVVLRQEGWLSDVGSWLWPSMQGPNAPPPSSRSSRSLGSCLMHCPIGSGQTRAHSTT